MSSLDIRRVGRAVAMGVLVVGFSAIVACGGPKKEEGTQAPAAPEATAPAKPAAPAPEAQAPAPQATAPATEAAAGGAMLGDAEKGKVIYQTYCVACHGPQGKGDGPAAASLTKKPANHSDGNYMNKIPNEELFKAIKEGGASVGKSNLMPAWGATLKDEQIKDVLAFVRSLAVPPYTGPR
jgi:mono/diheme cytochrome c family protein